MACFVGLSGLSGGFPLLSKLCFRVGLAGSGVYLNLRRQRLAFAGWCFLAFV